MLKRANSPGQQSSPALPSTMPHNHKPQQLSPTSPAASSSYPADDVVHHPMEKFDHVERQQHQPLHFQNPDIRVTDNADSAAPPAPAHPMGNHRDYRDRDTSHPRDYRDRDHHLGGAPPPRDYRERASNQQAAPPSRDHRDNQAALPRDYRDQPAAPRDMRDPRDYHHYPHTRDNQRVPPHEQQQPLRHNNVQSQRTSDYDRGPHTLPRSRAGEDHGERPRFSELLNSTTVTDHFDQYRTLRDDSGLGRDLDSPEERDRFVQKVRGAQTLQQTPVYTDRSPDSGLSDTDDSRYSRTRPLPRRKTLPSIMRGVPPNAAEPVKPKTSPRRRVAGETVHSNENLTPEESDTYIIENGIRKRVTAEVYAQPPTPAAAAAGPPPRPKASDEVPTDLPNRYHLVSQAKFGKGANRGSLPDVTACGELKKHVMPREQAAKLSHQRREELRRQQEEEERRKQQEIVLRLTDFKVTYSHSCFFWLESLSFFWGGEEFNRIPMASVASCCYSVHVMSDKCSLCTAVLSWTTSLCVSSTKDAIHTECILGKGCKTFALVGPV